MTMSSAGTTLTSEGEPRPPRAGAGPAVRRVEGEDRRHDDGGGARRGQPDEVALVGERVDGHVEPGQPERRAGQPEERRQPRRAPATRRAPRCARGSPGPGRRRSRSASESSCRPKGEVAPTSRATKPSAMSSTIETAMSDGRDGEVAVGRRAAPTTGRSSCCRVVNTLGASSAGPLALGQLAQRDDPRAGRRHEPPAVEDAAAGPAPPGWSRASPDVRRAQRAMTVSPADDPVARRDEQVALGRHEDVHPRAELHQAHPLAGGELVARPRPG